MGLILRNIKGSKLTFEEADGNFKYLEDHSAFWQSGQVYEKNILKYFNGEIYRLSNAVVYPFTTIDFNDELSSGIWVLTNQNDILASTELEVSFTNSMIQGNNYEIDVVDLPGLENFTTVDQVFFGASLKLSKNSFSFNNSTKTLTIVNGVNEISAPEGIIIAIVSFNIDVLGSNILDYKIINFTNIIPFDCAFTKIIQHSVNAPIKFFKNTNNAKPSYQAQVRLIADGVNEPDLSDFQISSNSGEYVNIAGVLNCIYFMFDGDDYWALIWQKQNAQAGDTTAPEIQSAIIESSNTSRIKLLYNEALANVAPANSNYTVTGNTVTNVTISSPFVLIDFATPFTVGQTVQISYTAGANKVQDLAGNFASNFTNYTVDNGSLGYTDIVFDNLSSGVTFDPNTKILSSNNNSFVGAYKSQVLNITSNFEVIHEILSDASVLIIDSDIDNQYTWASPQSHIAGIYKFQGTMYVSTTPNGFVVNSGQVTTNDNFAKLKKVGDNIVAYHSPDGVTNWVPFHTITGALAGVSQVYLKGLFAASDNLTLKGKYNE